MTFQDDMADDVTNVFLNTSEFAVSSTYYPASDATGFALTVFPGDADPNAIQIMEGQEINRTARFLCKRTSVRTGIAARLGTARDPLRGDTITIASGADAGSWRVQTVTPDIGDAVQLDCRLAEKRSVGAQNAQEVR